MRRSFRHRRPPGWRSSFSRSSSSRPRSFLAEGDGHFERLSELVRAGRILGARVDDARIAALCLEHAVTELWTVDRDFGRFPQLAARNPLVD